MLSAATALAGPASTDAVKASTAPVTISLPEAITFALTRATEVLKAKNQDEFSGSALLQAYFQFLPSLDAAAGYSWTWGRNYLTQGSPATVDTVNHGENYQLTAGFNVFSGGQDVGNLGASRSRAKAAHLSLYRAKQQIVLDVTQAYLQVLLDRKIALIGQKNLEASREREKLLQEQSDVGLKSLTDLYRQQAQTSADALFSISAENRARNSLIALLRRLRLDLMTAYDISDVAFDVETSSNPYRDERALMELALRQRPDLQTAEFLANAGRWDVTAARGAYYPRLDLFATVSATSRILDRQSVDGVDVVPAVQRSLSEQLHDQRATTAGVVASWGLFDRFATRLNVARAHEASKNADIDFEDRRLQVEAEVQQAVGDYQASLLQVAAAAQGLKAANASYDAVQERYRVGASSIVDLLTAQAALVQAQASDAQAHIVFMVEQKTMKTVLGESTY